jgi:hypothetical protein
VPIRGKQKADDWVVGAMLRSWAMIEIRSLTSQSRLTEIERLTKIRSLAHLCHNMPYLPGLSRDGERPFIHTWRAAGPEGRKWILEQVQRHNLTWTPPGEEPAPVRSTWRSRLRLGRS